MLKVPEKIQTQAKSAIGKWLGEDTNYHGTSELTKISKISHGLVALNRSHL